MMMSAIGGVFCGLMFGFLLGVTVVSEHYEDGRTECEIDLPRSDRCKSIWVPEETALKHYQEYVK